MRSRLVVKAGPVCRKGDCSLLQPATRSALSKRRHVADERTSSLVIRLPAKIQRGRLDLGCAKVVLSAPPICRGFISQLPSNASTSPFSPDSGENVADRPDEGGIQGRPRARKSPSPCPLPQIVCGDAASFSWLQPRKRFGGEGTLSGRPDGTNPGQPRDHQIQHFCTAQARPLPDSA